MADDLHYEPLKDGELEKLFDPLGKQLRAIKEAKTLEEKQQLQKELVWALQRSWQKAEGMEGSDRKLHAVELEGQMGLLGPAGSLTREHFTLDRLGKWTPAEA